MIIQILQLFCFPKIEKDVTNCDLLHMILYYSVENDSVNKWYALSSNWHNVKIQISY